MKQRRGTRVADRLPVNVVIVPSAATAEEGRTAAVSDDILKFPASVQSVGRADRGSRAIERQGFQTLTPDPDFSPLAPSAVGVWVLDLE